MPLFEARPSKIVTVPALAAVILGGDLSTPIFVRNLEVLTEATGGPAQLRRLVLEFAVRGALVPQQAPDGDGSSAIRQAKEHEAELVSGGQLRRRAPHTAVGADDQPFSVPPSWAWARFGELGDWGAGATPSRGNASYYGGTMPWFKSGELNDGYVHDAEEHVTELALRECSLRVNQPGDVLIAMYGATIGKVALARSICTTNQAVCACTCFNGVDNEFLLRVLKAFKHRFVEQGAGGAQPNISRVKIVETPCPVPPLAEQKRIVARVDQLMALIDDLEAKQTKKRDLSTRFTKASLEALTTADSPEDFDTAWHRVVENFSTVIDASATVDELRQSILALAVRGRLADQDPRNPNAQALLAQCPSRQNEAQAQGRFKAVERLPPPRDDEYGELPCGWACERLGNLCRFIDYRGKTPTKLPSGTRLITAKNVRMGFVNLEPQELIAAGDYSGWMTRGIPTNGDLLFTTEAPLGNVALFDFSEPVALAQRIIGLHPYCDLDSRFLMFVLMSPWFQTLLTDKATGMTATGIKASKLKELVVPIAPLAEQKRIVARVEHLMKLCDELEAKLRRAEDRASKLVEAVVKEIVA